MNLHVRAKKLIVKEQESETYIIPYGTILKVEKKQENGYRCRTNKGDIVFLYKNHVEEFLPNSGLTFL